MIKAQASVITGGVTQTSKMPCKSYSLPTVACHTGFNMAQVKGSVCSSCYANKGFYSMYAATVEPAQHARLESINLAIADADYRSQWIDAMVSLIGGDRYFRFHDSGDLQSVEHLELYAELADKLPKCRFWLPTREYGIVSAFTAVRDLPRNLIVRLSAMFPDKPVTIPASLQGAANVTVSNVHTDKPIGRECPAPKQSGSCGNCRACWSSNTVVSYHIH